MVCPRHRATTKNGALTDAGNARGISESATVETERADTEFK